LELIFPGVWKEVESRFDECLPAFQHRTFLTCVSEHDPSEDKYGRLSMWRAYGGSSGVALVLNSQVFTSPTVAMELYSSPVSYSDAGRFLTEFDRVAENVRTESSFLATQEREHLTHYLFNMLRFAAICTKHPGFEEEREWRVIHTRGLDSDRRLKIEVESVRGIPQHVIKIPLENVPEEGFYGAAIPDLIDRIIIGPTEFDSALYHAFIELLEKANVPDAAARIVISNIPVRVSKERG
ncbi:MAG: DUF2971 domain-containing protein, partial [Steroidobacteraceae bacterium]